MTRIRSLKHKLLALGRISRRVSGLVWRTMTHLMDNMKMSINNILPDKFNNKEKKMEASSGDVYDLNKNDPMAGNPPPPVRHPPFLHQQHRPGYGLTAASAVGGTITTGSFYGRGQTYVHRTQMPPTNTPSTNSIFNEDRRPHIRTYSRTYSRQRKNDSGIHDVSSASSRRERSHTPQARNNPRIFASNPPNHMGASPDSRGRSPHKERGLTVRASSSSRMRSRGRSPYQERTGTSPNTSHLDDFVYSKFDGYDPARHVTPLGRGKSKEKTIPPPPLLRPMARARSKSKERQQEQDANAMLASLGVLDQPKEQTGQSPMSRGSRGRSRFKERTVPDPTLSPIYGWQDPAHSPMQIGAFSHRDSNPTWSQFGIMTPSAAISQHRAPAMAMEVCSTSPARPSMNLNFVSTVITDLHSGLKLTAPSASPRRRSYVLINWNNGNHDHINVFEPYPAKMQDDRWDPKDMMAHVRMPCSKENRFPAQGDYRRHNTRGNTLVSRWNLIYDALSPDFRTISSTTDLEKAMGEYHKDEMRFYGLKALGDELDEESQRRFFNHTLPDMARMCLELPRKVTQPIPLMTRNKDWQLTFSQSQIACLLANAFFCTFPSRLKLEGFPDINFGRILTLDRPANMSQKLMCLLTYFRIMGERWAKNFPGGEGLVTFERRSLREQELPSWDTSLESLRKLHVSPTGTIEDDGAGMLEVDFANCYIGGGVLGRGCVQEEIRFLLSPELILSRLFTEKLHPNECIVITGFERFSKYSGYADSFKFEGRFEDKRRTNVDNTRHRESRLVAIDAILFRDKYKQYERHNILRELNKAYVGFYSANDKGEPVAVATGNWGCGAFGGDPQLKSLIQLMAAAKAKRDLAYFTFGDKKLAKGLSEIHELLVNADVSIAKLFQILCKYKRDGKYNQGVFDFIKSQLAYSSETPVQSDNEEELQGHAAGHSTEQSTYADKVRNLIDDKPTKPVNVPVMKPSSGNNVLDLIKSAAVETATHQLNLNNRAMNKATTDKPPCSTSAITKTAQNKGNDIVFTRPGSAGSIVKPEYNSTDYADPDRTKRPPQSSSEPQAKRPISAPSSERPQAGPPQRPPPPAQTKNKKNDSAQMAALMASQSSSKTATRKTKKMVQPPIAHFLTTKGMEDASNP